mgnify:CR=1 FL=1
MDRCLSETGKKARKKAAAARQQATELTTAIAEPGAKKGRRGKQQGGRVRERKAEQKKG